MAGRSRRVPPFGLPLVLSLVLIVVVTAVPWPPLDVHIVPVRQVACCLCSTALTESISRLAALPPRRGLDEHDRFHV